MPPLAAANNTTVNLKQSQIGAVWRGLALGGGMWLAAACSAEGEPELGIPLTRNRSTSTQPRATTSEHVAHGLADSGAPELAASTQQPAPNPVSSATEQTVVPAPSLGNGAGLGENPPETEPSQVPAPDATTPSSATSTEPPETQPSAAMSSAGALASDTPPAAPSGGFFGGFGAGTDDAPEPEEPPLGEGGAGGEQGSGEAGSGEAGAPTTGGAGGVAGNPGGSFGGEPGDECNALAVGINSGAIGTQAVCFVVNGPLQGWQVSNLMSRTLTVNGATVVAPALPAAPDGTYTFEFSAGDPEYTAFSTW